MRQSHIGMFNKCPYQYELNVIKQLETIKNQDFDNALYLGTAIHYGAETGSISKMLHNYFNNYYLIDDLQINESMKLEYLLPQVLEVINQYEEQLHEVKFDLKYFHGTADFLGRNKKGNWDLYDFKYSNNKSYYLESPQLHIYKYFLEKQGYKIDNMAFIFIPKTKIRQKVKSFEDLYTFRRRLKDTLSTMQVSVDYMNYDESKVTESLESVIKILQTKTFEKTPSKLCDWCQYQKYCLKEMDYMILPKNERREVKVNTSPDMWLYGESYSGKTVFLDSFDNVLMLNTDGNVDHISSPVLRITDEVTVEGRITKRKFAWQVFLEAINELEKKDNDFKTIVVDLVEDLFEHCRLYIFDREKIEHEQDAGFGKGWDMVTMEFVSNMKRLKNCGYQTVYISKSIVKEVTKKNQEKITTYAPNIRDKIANILAGTVDLTARITADGDKRFMSFKTSPYIFGGSRYNFGVTEIPLNKEEFLKVLVECQNTKEQEVIDNSAKVENEEPKVEEVPATEEPNVDEEVKPKRTRKKKESMAE